MISLTLENYALNEVSAYAANPQLHRLSVTLKGFEQPLPTPAIVMALLHLVEDGEGYQNKMTKNITSVSPFSC